MVYWLVSLPLQGKRKEVVWETLQATTSASSLSNNAKFEVPELRVGTLDTLMALSDDLNKSSTVMEAVVGKIRRTVGEIGGATSVGALKVDGLPPDAYLARFKWDEAKYPARRPLKETVDKVHETTARIEDDLKVKVAEYNTLKQQLAAVSRKATGSLSVRDISTMVKKQHAVDSENLGTLFVVIAKSSLSEWDTSYETMCKYIVPRSSQKVGEDNDYVLVNVVMFKRAFDDFKHAARTKGYQVREYHAEAQEGELSAGQLEQLKRDADSKKAALEQWCKTAYGEALSAWVHITAIRLFVESILRYGLPPAFQAAVLRPAEKMEAKLRDTLASNFGDGKAKFWKDDGAPVVAVSGIAQDQELYPYVSFSLNLE